jgi:hypothetical protein
MLTQPVDDYPAASMATLFALGVGVGMAIGCSLAHREPPRESWYDSGMAERLGRRMLDAVAGVVPESIVNRLKP